MLLVASGGALGALSRYLISFYFKQNYDFNFPWHTFIINISGCFLIGASLSLLRFIPDNEWLKIFVMVGVLGGFTTFSSFGLETFQLISAKHFITAFLYVSGSVFIGLAAVYFGYVLLNHIYS